MSFSLLAIKAVLRACCNPCNFFLNRYTYIAALNCYNSNLLMVKIPSFYLLSVSSYMQINCHENFSFPFYYKLLNNYNGEICQFGSISEYLLHFLHDRSGTLFTLKTTYYSRLQCKILVYFNLIHSKAFEVKAKQGTFQNKVVWRFIVLMIKYYNSLITKVFMNIKVSYLKLGKRLLGLNNTCNSCYVHKYPLLILM